MVSLISGKWRRALNGTSWSFKKKIIIKCKNTHYEQGWIGTCRTAILAKWVSQSVFSEMMIQMDAGFKSENDVPVYTGFMSTRNTRMACIRQWKRGILDGVTIKEIAGKRRHLESSSSASGRRVVESQWWLFQTFLWITLSPFTSWGQP